MWIGPILYTKNIQNDEKLVFFRTLTRNKEVAPLESVWNTLAPAIEGGGERYVALAFHMRDASESQKSTQDVRY